MTPINLARALKFTLNWEGGYSDDPDDAGGATNMGITQGTYNAWLGSHSKPHKAVRYIAREEVETIYFERYWFPSKAGQFEWPLSLAIFDTAVNFGLTRAKEFLKGNRGKPVERARVIVERRIAWRHSRVASKPSQSKFLKGWLRRDNALLAEIEGVI
jgi:hypothetical protein